MVVDKFYTFLRPYLKILLPISFIYYICKENDKSHPLRLIVNYYGFNDITIPVRYLTSLINKLQNHLAGVKYFIKIDLKLGFYFIWMVEGEE